jgi:hypothetical protein
MAPALYRVLEQRFLVCQLRVVCLSYVSIVGALRAKEVATPGCRSLRRDASGDPGSFRTDSVLSAMFSDH